MFTYAFVSLKAFICSLLVNMISRISETCTFCKCWSVRRVASSK